MPASNTKDQLFNIAKRAIHRFERKRGAPVKRGACFNGKRREARRPRLSPLSTRLLQLQLIAQIKRGGRLAAR